MKLTMLGLPGSGKGTQAALLSEKYDVPHISAGEIIRQEIEKESDFGKAVQEFEERGELVPPPTVVDYMLNLLKDKEGFILDGFPRNMMQALPLEQEIVLDAAIYLELPDEEAVKRITGRRICPKCKRNYHVTYNPPQQEGKCDICDDVKLIQRKDDHEEAIRKRISVFYDETMPLIDHYEEQGILVRVDDDQPIKQVFHEMVEKLERAV